MAYCEVCESAGKRVRTYVAALIDNREPAPLCDRHLEAVLYRWRIGHAFRSLRLRMLNSDGIAQVVEAAKGIGVEVEHA